MEDLCSMSANVLLDTALQEWLGVYQTVVLMNLQVSVSKCVIIITEASSVL